MKFDPFNSLAGLAVLFVVGILAGGAVLWLLKNQSGHDAGDFEEIEARLETLEIQVRDLYEQKVDRRH